MFARWPDVGPAYDAFEARDCHPIVKLRQIPARSA
jgi:hypothetical protein